MAAQRSSTNQWVIVIAIIGVLMSVGNGFWSLANPHGDIEGLKKDLADFRNRVEWRYAQKDMVEMQIKRLDQLIVALDTSSVNKDGYTQRINSIETNLTVLRSHINDLNKSINLTYNAKDALAAMQSRIIELERAIRDTPKPINK